MSLLLAIPLGIIPMVIYPIFIYWMDRFEKEPLHMIAGAFIWGFVPAAILSIISQLLFGFPFMLMDETGVLFDVVGTIVLAPITEEVFKGLAVFAVYWFWRDEFDGVFDGIIYGALVGFGFAAIENILYFLEGDAFLFVFRAIVFGLNHAFFTSLTGIGLGIARHSQKGLTRFAAPILGLLAAMLAHFIHNASTTFSTDAPALLCVAGLNAWGGALFVFVLIVLAIRRERRWIEEQLLEEVPLRILSHEQYEIISSPVRRFSERLGLLFNGGPGAYLRLSRYHHTLTELAYKKHAYARQGDKGAKPDLIEKLRAEAAVLGAELGLLD